MILFCSIPLRCSGSFRIVCQQDFCTTVSPLPLLFVDTFITVSQQYWIEFEGVYVFVCVCGGTVDVVSNFARGALVGSFYYFILIFFFFEHPKKRKKKKKRKEKRKMTSVLIALFLHVIIFMYFIFFLKK